MPIPTDTFRNITKLNMLFATSAVLLLASTIWMVVADHERPWRAYQVDAKKWQFAMTVDAQEAALTSAFQAKLQETKAERDEIHRQILTDQRVQQHEAELRLLITERNKRTLPTEVKKGQVNPSAQLFEHELLAAGSDDPRTRKLKKEKDAKTRAYASEAVWLAENQLQIERTEAELKQLHADEIKKSKQLADLQRRVNDFDEKLAQLNPTGAAWIGEQLRNAPLMDWANASYNVEQTIVDDVRTDYNFMTVETIDRCKTCHINIDNRAFARPAQIAFVERQIARRAHHPVDSIDKPVVMLDYWLEAAALIEPIAGQLQQISEWTLEALNALHAEAETGLEIESTDQLIGALEELTTAKDTWGGASVSRKRWYQLLAYYESDVRKLLDDHLGKMEYDKLVELYRRQLIDRYNVDRKQDGKRALSANPVLLAHSNLKRFVDPDSSHPMKTMGCTVCHEGSGQETQFEFTAHEPRQTWVDRKTGAVVPSFLITDDTGHTGGKREYRTTHFDLNLNNPDDPAPFAPRVEPHSGVRAKYVVPGEDEPRFAVLQSDYWAKQYRWHQVHYMHWEKPMHALQYVESSCNRCHTEVYDLKDAAPKLFAGRQLFSQMGCINCHAADTLKDDLDIKQVGPSLANVKQKLSPEMMATWIWSPKAFRPTTKMPHYFMLDNNASPVDILRTRVEVAAITHYLLNSDPDADYYKQQGTAVPQYDPQPLPEQPGDPIHGRTIFNNVGCLSCHSNLNEFGQSWITEYLVKRGQDQEQARETFEAMSYNQQHWYVLEHLSDRLERTGPELSGVGTKLLAGRSRQQARTWLYDWLRNPRHYSSYTIMPSFRLTEDEANDLTSYLLSLERPGYQDGDSAYVPGDFSLDESGRNMLRELVANVEVGAITLTMARQKVADNPSYDSDEKLLVKLGRKMITHYGCNGCHLVNGFESAVSACTNLDDWGLKDPHKLAFGYFDHTFDKIREKPIIVSKVKHEGLSGDVSTITLASRRTPENTDGRIQDVSIQWEHMALERRPWLYNKLHNTRLYDRGRRSLDGKIGKGDTFDIAAGWGVGKPYEKLKMPKFFFTDDQVEQLVTFVTSIRKPLVTGRMQQVADSAKLNIIRGRQLATLYNCYGCHNIEGNPVNIQQYFNVRLEEGGYDENALNWAPPRLVGQGAKTHPDWLYHFLQNVEPIRPWMKVRMPSFPLHEQGGQESRDARVLVDYLAGHSQVLSDRLANMIAPIETHFDELVQLHPDTPWTQTQWYNAAVIAENVADLEAFAIRADLVFPGDLDPHQNDAEDLGANWSQLLKNVRALAQTYETDYPYVQKYKPNFDSNLLRRAEGLFFEMGCMAGECHRMGDTQQLIEAGYLVPANPFGALQPTGEVDSDEADEDEDEEEYDEEEEDGGLTLTPSYPPAGAPNLSMTYQRLQARWVRQWSRHATSIQPGTRMQNFWVNEQSFFANLPDLAVRRHKESLYGQTAQQQQDLIMYMLYAAGPRSVTYNPAGGRLDAPGSSANELAPLEPLQQVQVEPETAKPQADHSEPAEATEPAAQIEYDPIAVAAPVPVPVAKTSNIVLHEDTQSYQGTRIVGVVHFAGKLKRPKKLKMGADQYCLMQHDSAPRHEQLVFDKSAGTLQNVFIYVKEGFPRGSRFAAPAATIINQQGCMYRPHVVGVMVGQPLTILSSDNTPHNVKMKSAKNRSFNEAMVKGQVLTKKFKKAEVGSMALKCDVHSWMGARIHVVDHPFFAVSDVQGRFEITGLPPGTYTLEAVHEHRRIQPVEFTVVIAADTSQRQDVTVNYQ